MYIRVFNRGGNDVLSSVPDLVQFGQHLLSHVAATMNAGALLEEWTQIETEALPKLVLEGVSDEEATLKIPSTLFSMTLSAMNILVKVDGLLDDSIGGSRAWSHTLLSLLELPLTSQNFDVASEMLGILCPKQFFADSVVQQGCLWRVFRVLERREDFEDSSGSADGETATVMASRKAQCWRFLESLSSSSSIASVLFSSSCWLELLGVLSGYTGFTKVWGARLGAAKTLSRLLWDPSTGPVGGKYE